jgi:hypothetical protein
MIGRSRIDLQNVPARSRAVESKPFDVLMLNGPATWGPMNQATVVVDYPDFYDKFGGFMASYFTPLAAKLFFDGGGKRLVFTRICHIADHTASSTPASAVKATVDLSTAVGGTYSAQVTLTVTAKYYGTRGNSFTIKIQDASNGEAARFDLLIYEGVELLEWHRNLSMLNTDARYVETVINTSDEASRFIEVTDAELGGAGGLAADERPENTTGTLLTTGDDGLTSLDDNDYIGANNYNTGLYAFNLEEQGDILITPDDTTSAYQNAATTYMDTQKKGKGIFVCEAPASSDKAGIVTHAQALTASEYRTACYWPRVYISNPNKTIYGQATRILIPPSPLIAGRYVRNSNLLEEKYFGQPGNEVWGLLEGAVALETIVVREPAVRDWVTDYGVNPIMDGIRGTDGNYGVWMDDVLLGQTSLNFVSVGEQRGMAYLRTIFEAYLQRHRTQNNTPIRRRTVKEAFEGELLKWTGRNAFASTNAAEAFYVHTDPDGVGLNNPAVQDEQRFRILVGVATARPGRFIELMFTRDNRAVESWIQQQLTATGAA